MATREKPTALGTGGPAVAVPLLHRAHAALLVAERATTPAEQLVQAHLAALKAAAAVVAWSAPVVPTARRRARRSVWEQVVEAAPELTGWASAFAAQAERRAQVEAGIGPAVDRADAHRVLLQAEAFLVECAAVIGWHDTGSLDPVRAAG